MKSNRLRAIPGVLLGALFLTLAIGLALLSSGVYRSVVATADHVDGRRTALSYLVNQTRRGDIQDGIALGKFGDSDAIFLHEADYQTILYGYQGQLCELYMEEDADLKPEDGMKVAQLADLKIKQTQGTIQFEITDSSGERYTAAVTPRSGLQEDLK